MRVFLILFFLFNSSCIFAFIKVNPIIRSNHTNNGPTCNSYLVYNDKEFLIIDVGKYPSDGDSVCVQAKQLMEEGGLRLNGVFVTHGHPDHASQLYRVLECTGGTAYVGSEAERLEMVQVMRVFGWQTFPNASSPERTFNYSSVAVVSLPTQLWSVPGELTIKSKNLLLGESNHYSWLVFSPQNQQQDLIFVGDLVYWQTYVFMGFDVGLDAQCEWMAALDGLHDFISSSGGAAGVALYSGHGPLIPDALEAIEWCKSYIQFARTIFLSTCSPSEALTAITTKYPNLGDLLLLSAFTIPARVPGDVKSLGCSCQGKCNVEIGC